MATTDQSLAGWRTSSYSNVGGNCVEVAAADSMVGVRDTKNRAGVAVTFSPAAWQRFATWTKSAAKP